MDSPRHKVEKNEPEVCETTKHAKYILDISNKVGTGRDFSC